MKHLLLVLLTLCPLATGKGWFAPSAPWSPRSIGSTIFYLNAKNGVAQSSGTVSSWGDLSGNGYDMAPLNGAPTYNATGMNSAYPTVTFDGTDDNVGRIGLGGSTRSTFSWFAYVKPGTLTTYDVIWYAPSTSASWLLTNSINFYLDYGSLASNSIDYWIQNIGAKGGSGVNTVVANTPVIIGGTYDGTNITTRINTAAAGTTAYSNGVIGDRISIGGLNPGYAGANAAISISEMAFWSKILSTDEWAALLGYVQENWYPIWRDATRSYSFNGDSYSAGAGTPGNWEYTQPLTRCVWARPASSPTDKRSIMGHELGVSPFGGFDMLIELDGKPSLYMSNTWPTNVLYAKGSDVVPSNGVTWSFICAANGPLGTAADLDFYVNAHKGTTSAMNDTLSATIQNPSLNFYLGEAWGTTPYNGEYDEFYIFTAKLDQTDIDYLYHSGLPRDITGYHDLAHWWRMGEATGDSNTTIHDIVGGWDVTRVGSAGAISSAHPQPLTY